MTYEHAYFFIGLLLLAALGFAAAPLVISAALRPRKPSRTKQDIYECGLESQGDSWVQFKVQYYIYALIFVVFDLETVFLLPWAVAFNKLGAFAFFEMTIFLIVLAAGLVWAWGKGVLEWK